jgi:hypothetical protein
MITSVQLNMVKVYLQQELPASFYNSISLEHNQIIIDLPTGNRSFMSSYNILHVEISALVARIRHRDYDLTFIVRGTIRTKKFVLLK